MEKNNNLYIKNSLEKLNDRQKKELLNFKIDQ